MRQEQSLVRHAWLAALGLVVPLGAGGIALAESFDGLYGQDSYVYLDYGTGPLRESLGDLELPPEFFWPPGYTFFVALASFVVGREALAGQLVSLLAAASVPVTTALLARELWPRDTGRRLPLAALVAGLLVGFTGQLWQSGVVVMADALALALATGGAAALARYGRRGDIGWLLTAAGLLAGAVATRWAYMVVAAPCAVYAVTVVARRPRREAIAHLAAAVAVAIVVLTPVLVRPIARGTGPDSFTGSFGMHSWSATRIFEREFETSDGILTYSVPTGLYYGLIPAHWAFFTPLLAPLVFVGAWAVVRRPTAGRVLLLLAWPAIVYLFHAGAAYQGFRFGLAYLPPLAVLAGIGAERIAGRLTTRHLGTVLGIAVLVAGLAVMAAGGTRLTRDLIARKDDGLALVRWVEDVAPPGARVISFNLTHTLRYYGDVETLELYELAPRRLRRLVSSERPLFLLVDVPSLRGQWRNESPGRNFRWLEREAGLTPLGTRGGFTLFRV